MKSGAFKRALGLVFLYLGLFIVIVLVQFSRGPGLSEKFGALSVSASYPKAGRGRADVPPEMVRLSYAGLLFEISPKSPAESLTADGAASPLALISMDKLPNGVRIKLSPGVELKATSNRRAPEDLFPLGYRSRRRRRPSPALRAFPRGAVFRERRPPRPAFAGGSYDLAARYRPPWTAERASFPSVRATRARPVQDSAARGGEARPPGVPAKLVGAGAQGSRSLQGRDLRLAGQGLVGPRFDSASMPTSSPGRGRTASPPFPKRPSRSIWRSPWRSGSYSDALARARSAKEKWPDKLGYLSAPYLGGLVPKMRAFEASDLAEVKRLPSSSPTSPRRVFEKEGLLRFLVDRSPGLARPRRAPLFSPSSIPPSLRSRQAVGAAGLRRGRQVAAQGRWESLPRHRPPPPPHRRSARPAMRKSSSGYFLVTEDDGSTDLRLSLLAGTALVCLRDRRVQAGPRRRGAEPRRGRPRPGRRPGLRARARPRRVGRRSAAKRDRCRPRTSIPSSPTIRTTRTRLLRPRHLARRLGLDLRSLAHRAGEPFALHVPRDLPRRALALPVLLRDQAFREHPALRHRLQPRQRIRELRRLRIPLQQGRQAPST